MNKKLKNVILFGVFILFLFLSTLSSQFDSSVLWKNVGDSGESFNGLLFKNPLDVSNLTVSRSIESNSSKKLVKYDVEFDYLGDDSSVRILGTPVRQIFFGDAIEPSHSVVTLKGDYDKINNRLFNEKLSLRDYYKKTSNYNLKAISQIRVPLVSSENTYSFTIYYEPRELLYRGKNLVSETDVFITNVTNVKFANTQKMNDGENTFFKDDGFYVNAQEIKENKTISRISLLNNLSYIVFAASVVIVLAFVWLDNKRLNKFYPILLMLILITFYRFLGKGSTTLGVLISYPILGYIGITISKLMSKEALVVTKNELKQNLAYTLVFLVVVLVLIIIPRAF
ncbi:hypothetical protein [Anaerosphaera multitolerans]|uniref:Uncharacterized protein n=1 Tax=Anaerosphaera multitolerans TaxID=2487351 RepID=A0A437S838_9FIRM|nr:hypothetical protein [Anaerosphaera multitolerans]RVU55250.1 hypothetical protein EF514_02980 [Anaerosphaera multitolerans]